MIQLGALVFDMDGVLVDVSESYRDATCQTVRLYLETGLGLDRRAGDWVSRDQVAAFKLAGGFNNDWDLTAAILMYYLANLEAGSLAPTKPERPVDVLAYLGKAGSHIHSTLDESALKEGLVFFASQVGQAGGGLDAARRRLGDRNDHLLFASGDPRATNLVKRIFEEVYLGEEQFRAEYGETPLVARGEGLQRRERLIAGKETLDALGKHVALGIATGRPRRQALAALERFRILDLFRSMLTLEDVVAEEKRQFQSTGKTVRLSKPDPYALWQAARRLAPDLARFAYVGDTPDDVRAANAAKSAIDYISIGCLASARDPEELRREFERAGADVIIRHPDELLDWVEK